VGPAPLPSTFEKVLGSQAREEDYLFRFLLFGAAFFRLFGAAFFLLFGAAFLTAFFLRRAITFRNTEKMHLDVTRYAIARKESTDLFATYLR